MEPVKECNNCLHYWSNNKHSGKCKKFPEHKNVVGTHVCGYFTWRLLFEDFGWEPVNGE